jgi:hypothetical protein
MLFITIATMVDLLLVLANCCDLLPISGFQRYMFEDVGQADVVTRLEVDIMVAPWGTDFMTNLKRASKDGWETSGPRRTNQEEAPWGVGAKEGGSPVLLPVGAGGEAWFCQERV